MKLSIDAQVINITAVTGIKRVIDMEERLYEVEGFAFRDEETAKQAKKEIAGVKYLKARVDMDNPEMVLQIYNKTIREELFQTPIGVAYLRELQEYLYEIPYIEHSAILSIPVCGVEHTPKKEKTKEEKQTKQNRIDFKKRYQVTFFFAVIFFIMIIAMFAISFTSDSTTIINYENKIINQYEEWEQELEQREQELNRREAEQN